MKLEEANSGTIASDVNKRQIIFLHKLTSLLLADFLELNCASIERSCVGIGELLLKLRSPEARNPGIMYPRVLPDLF